MQYVINFIFQIDFILAGLFLFFYLLKSFVSFVKTSFTGAVQGTSDTVPPVEFPTENEVPIPKYDVEGFRARMSKLKFDETSKINFDEDGLYTPFEYDNISAPSASYPISNEISTLKYNDSGVEIITPGLENEIERRIKP